MIDITAHPISFGGVAFEPQTEAGRQFLIVACQNLGEVFCLPDPCMTDFLECAVGVQPWDVAAMLDMASAAGVTVKGAGND